MWNFYYIKMNGLEKKINKHRDRGTRHATETPHGTYSANPAIVSLLGSFFLRRKKKKKPLQNTWSISISQLRVVKRLHHATAPKGAHGCVPSASAKMIEWNSNSGLLIRCGEGVHGGFGFCCTRVCICIDVLAERRGGDESNRSCPLAAVARRTWFLKGIRQEGGPEAERADRLGWRNHHVFRFCWHIGWWKNDPW